MRVQSLRRGTALMWMQIAVFGLLVCQACDRGSVRVENRDQGVKHIEYHDLVMTQALETDGEPIESGEVFAADETWVAVTLQAGATVTADLAIGSDPSLTLAGCMECPDRLWPRGRAELIGDVDAGEGRQVPFSIDLDPAGGWWTGEVDLTRVSNLDAELTLDLSMPRGCVLKLREATLRQYRAEPPPLAEAPKQVLLISVDTLRYDAIGAYGGAESTPNLDRLVRQAESYSRHYSAASWTKPSHGSMLTGYSPGVHRAQLADQIMDPSIPTLAGRFKDAGFTTAALVFDCGWLSPRWGFSKGFDQYVVTKWRSGRQTRAAANWLLDHREEPFFVFLHTFEPHSDGRLLPYEAPGLNQLTIAEQFGVEDFGCRQGHCASEFVEGLHKGDVTREPRDGELLHASYSSGVRYLDDALGTLFDDLREGGIWDQLLVVVTSDHGEEFDEHGGFGHHTLYDEITRVPLIIKWPNGDLAGSTRDTVCTAVDLAPTLLNYSDCPTDGLPGSHLHHRNGETPVFSGTLDRAVVAGGFKAIFSYRSKLVQLFNLDVDPEELNNLAEVESERVRDLRELLRKQDQREAALRELIGSDLETGGVVMSDRERERLKALGYLQ